MMMHAWGARGLSRAPATADQCGRDMLAGTPDSPGSLGIAISEAVEDAATHADTNYSLGSVLNHVLLHQTVIGQEAKLQMEQAGEEPDVVIGCFGGGSNFGGLALPYVLDRLAGKGLRIVAVEPTACPSLTKGSFEYDYGDTAKLTPLVKMYTLGHEFVPPGIHAGGLRYHGASPLISHLVAPRPYRSPRLFADSGLRGRRPVRAHGGNPARARVVARDPRRRRRGPRRPRGGPPPHHPVLSERPRPFRSLRLRESLPDHAAVWSTFRRQLDSLLREQSALTLGVTLVLIN